MTPIRSLAAHPDAPTPTPLPFTAADVAEIAGQVWDSFLGLPLTPVHEQGAGEQAVAGQEALSGLVAISGAWEGYVVLRCSAAHAAEAAEAMFGADPGTLSGDEVADAMGELTNMVGGNLKSMLPEPSALSIPSVTGGTAHRVFVPGARPVLSTELLCDAAPVLVTVWQS